MPDLHIVLAGYLRHPPLPSHLPSSPQVATSAVAQVVESRGASPDPRFTHVPGEATDEQVLQPSVQATLQQTLSTQWPLPH
jgi:hypothetical protein